MVFAVRRKLMRHSWDESWLFRPTMCLWCDWKIKCDNSRMFLFTDVHLNKMRADKWIESKMHCICTIHRICERLQRTRTPYNNISVSLSVNASVHLIARPFRSMNMNQLNGRPIRMIQFHFVQQPADVSSFADCVQEICNRWHYFVRFTTRGKEWLPTKRSFA